MSGSLAREDVPTHEWLSELCFRIPAGFPMMNTWMTELLISQFYSCLADSSSFSQGRCWFYPSGERLSDVITIFFAVSIKNIASKLIITDISIMKCRVSIHFLCAVEKMQSNWPVWSLRDMFPSLFDAVLSCGGIFSIEHPTKQLGRQDLHNMGRFEDIP